MIQIINGNILDAENCILCQQVNHRGVMGAGLAKQIVEKYPGILAPYQEFCKNHSFEDICKNYVVHLYVPPNNKQSIIVANIFGQKHYGVGLQTDYSALSHGLIEVNRLAKDRYVSKHVAIPYKIGCGLAGGDWNVVLGIIHEAFYDDIDVRIYNYERNNIDEKEEKKYQELG